MSGLPSGPEEMARAHTCASMLMICGASSTIGNGTPSCHYATFSHQHLEHCSLQQTVAMDINCDKRRVRVSKLQSVQQRQRLG